MQIWLCLQYNLIVEHMSTQPQRVNSNHFSTEKFPEVIAFCERDDQTHVLHGSEESYEYKLNGQTLYQLKKYAAQWELIELMDKKVMRVSTGRNLGIVLMQGLRFADADKGKQEERVNVLVPVMKKDAEKAAAMMYYFGGYPASFLELSPELAIIIERFVDPQLTFLSYSYVPVAYLPWLNEELKKAEILQEGADKTIWVYKK